MSPFVHLVRKAHPKASRYWLVLVYIAVIVTLILAFAVEEVAQRLA